MVVDMALARETKVLLHNRSVARTSNRYSEREIRKKDPMSEELVVVARNPAEMQVAQQKLITWAESKVAETQTELDEAEGNLTHAIKSKWRQTGFKKIIARARERLNYYTKVEAALRAGYVIVPNFDIDIFAIRTTKDKPNSEGVTHRYGKPHPNEFENNTDRPQLGDGEYVDPFPQLEHTTELIPYVEDKGKGNYKEHYAEATTWRPVDFPFKLVKPQILSDTSTAMAQKIFDEIGVTPHRQVRKQDPMVIGQVVYKKDSRTEKRLSFLLAWWVESSDLEV